MKRHAFKLWIIVFLILAIVGIASIKYTIPVHLETANHVNVETGELEENSWVLSVKQDFLNFFAISSDFVNTVFKGEESKFDSGYNALLSKEKIDTEKAEEDIKQFTESAKEKSKTVIETLSEKINPQDEAKSENLSLTPASVTTVVDGDTFFAKIGDLETKIRLIGIDTPESVHAEQDKNTVWGTYASDHTKELLAEGQVVYLEYDIETTDKYGRTLAYAWLSEDTSEINNMLNYRLLVDGYATDKIYAPNIKYSDSFAQAKNMAKNENVGLWESEEFAKLWEEN